MAQNSFPVCLAANMICSGFYLFTRPYDKATNTCNCTSICSIIFLTAVFAWVSVKNINLFKCKLPDKAMFFYEFFVSLFIFEMALRLFWEPLECFITSALPAALEDIFLDGECCMAGLYCRGDNLVFVAVAYSIALAILWCVMSGYGVMCDLIG